MKEGKEKAEPILTNNNNHSEISNKKNLKTTKKNY
jgi:hypothetical protein